MGFEQPRIQDASKEKLRNNRLLELSNPLQAADIMVEVQKNIERTSKSLTDEQKERRMKRHLYKFEIITKVKDYYEERWGKMNKSLIKDETLSPDQITQRDRFVDNIRKEEIGRLLDQWNSDWERAASQEHDKKEKNDIYLYIDALQELSADVTNW